MKSEAQIRSDLEKAQQMDAALNGPVYPLDSLHAQGFPAAGCQFCMTRLNLEYVLGESSRVSGRRPRKTPWLTKEELADLQVVGQRNLDKQFRRLLPDPEINNLYELD